MKVSMFISLLLLFILLLVLVIHFRNPIKIFFRKKKEFDAVVSKNVDKFFKEINKCAREKANETTKECQERMLKIIKKFVIDHEGNPYYHERVLILKEIIKIIDTTGEWPVSVIDIYYLITEDQDEK